MCPCVSGTNIFPLDLFPILCLFALGLPQLKDDKLVDGLKPNNFLCSSKAFGFVLCVTGDDVWEHLTFGDDAELLVVYL